MLRIICPLLALLAALTSIAVARVQPRPDAAICQVGGCRYEAMMATLEDHGATPSELAALLRADASNPHMWATWGDYLTGVGDIARAELAFAQAEATGPGLAPVLMRSANFAFTHDRTAHGLQLVPRILAQTSDFDEILFAYLDDAGVDPTTLGDTVIPPMPRAARAWLAWTREHGRPQDVLTVWSWLHQRAFADDATAADTVKALWTRKAFDEARHVWTDHKGQSWYSGTNLLANPRFEGEPTGTPFDWDLSKRPGVEYTRRDGLELRFDGSNLTDAGVVQFALVEPGVYRFSADVSAEALSTDEGVTFDIEDVDNPSRRVQTSPLVGTIARTTISADVPVSADTRVLRVQLRRTASLKFDNKLSGVLHVHRVELVPVAVSPVQ